MSAEAPDPAHVRSEQEQQEAEEKEEIHEEQERHEEDVEEREALESWGYLFRPDKTGTDSLRGLLRGLKDAINENYDAADGVSDLTPTQLAAFYRELGGNYDQLFLGTPSASLAFIYKSLGCLHSLQPLPHSPTAYTDPSVPALKTEGWILWQTIQILLAPEEHSAFLRAAVARWDVRGPEGGGVLPKVLPRGCFPAVPDKHMVAWYEGVSERLKREAEAEVAREEGLAVREETDEELDDASIDSRGPAIAYFRNPLFRHVDARAGPGPVGRESRRPGLSPGHPGRDAVDSRAPGTSPGRRLSRGPSRSRDRDRERRRKSLPDHRHYAPVDLPPVEHESRYDDRLSPGSPPAHRHRRHRRGSRPVSAGAPPGPEEDLMEEDVPPADRIPTPLYSPRPPPEAHHHHPHHRHHLPDPRLRHTRSHEPTPTFFDDGAEPDGYFPPPSSYPHPHLPNRRSFSPTSDAPYQSPPPPDASSPPPPPIPGFGPSLGPSASPLFASHIARQPQPPPPMGTGSPPMGPEPQYRDFAHPPPPHPDGRRRSRPPPGYDSPPPEPGRNGRHRRRGEDPRMPMRGPPPHHRDRRSLDPRDRRMYDDRPPLDDRPPFGRPPYDDRPPYADRPPFDDRPPYDERPPYDDSPPPPRRRSRRRSDAGRRRPISPGDPRSRSGSEFGPPEGARDGRRGSVGKMTRFAEKGVGGRRYA